MERVAFGEFVVDVETRELTRNGKPVSLSPKAFQLLGILVEQRPKALSKNTLQDHLWPGTFVVEKNLTNLVGEIRAALGDDAAEPRFIRTIPRFGYAFHGALAVEARRHNLPEPLTTFVGRGGEIAELGRLVRTTRLLTLTGAGGCGKTRLALEVARRALDGLRDGAWLVELASVSDDSLVIASAAAVFDVRQETSASLEQALAEYLRQRTLLLVLDNCEHLVGAVARLADLLLTSAAGLTILATSREGLGIGGETLWRVPSLSLPSAAEPASADALVRYEAVALLLDRAAAAGSPFALSQANAATVAEVCRRLDGIPLALELAAARLKLLSIEQVHDRLQDRFRLLTGGSRNALARQRTLEAAVGWSYDLLSAQERTLLLRLSVFAGGWTLEAAEQVCSDAAIEGSSVLDLLTRLADKSLVNVGSDADDPRRYGLLETIRHYARERLVESGGADTARDRHAAVFRDMARSAAAELMQAHQAQWLGRLDVEHDNLRAALDWSLTSEGRGGERGLELAASLFWFWLKRGYCAEGQMWLERALAASPSAHGPLRATAVLGLGNMVFFQGHFSRARTLLVESAALARNAGDRATAAIALGIAALAALELRDFEAAGSLASEGRTEGQASSAPWSQAPSLTFFAYQALHAGDWDRAGLLLEEVLALCRWPGDTWAITIALFDLALLRVLQRRLAAARALCDEGLVLARESRDRRAVAWFLGVLAGAAAVEGDARRAATLHGAMEGLLDAVGSPVQPSFKTWIDDRYFGGVREALGGRGYKDALDEGRSMPTNRAIEYALGERG